MIRYTYDCEVCGEQDFLLVDRPEDAEKRIACTVCGATGAMVRIPPKTATHFHPSRGKK
jgi:hypothetical protein